MVNLTVTGVQNWQNWSSDVGSACGCRKYHPTYRFPDVVVYFCTAFCGHVGKACDMGWYQSTSADMCRRDIGRQTLPTMVGQGWPMSTHINRPSRHMECSDVLGCWQSTGLIRLCSNPAASFFSFSFLLGVWALWVNQVHRPNKIVAHRLSQKTW